MGCWFLDDEWKAGIEALNRWLTNALYFVDWGGENPLDAEFFAESPAVIDFVRDKLGMEARPIIEVTDAIEIRMQHMRRRRPGEELPSPEPIEDIARELRIVRAMLERAYRLGTTDKRPGTTEAEEPTEAVADCGVSLYDFALVFCDNDPDEARQQVKVIRGRKPKCASIGKDPHNRNANLYRLEEILGEMLRLQYIKREQKQHYRQRLRSQLREPCP